ncbi:hypothetical protein QBC44DRAFT_246574 [Cladorrhinum sp. PSN332]|nr:hypothetical protein QBC44DRAFT_246574 [Cladorrhinum sp. PSN332]
MIKPGSLASRDSYFEFLPCVHRKSKANDDDCSSSQQPSLSWSRVGRYLVSFAWFSFILGLTLFLIVWGCLPAPPSACKPDGSFSPFSDDYRWWSPRSFFEMTLQGGSFSFAEAKVIDIGWDLVIGRGGQLLVTYISWHTFARHTAISVQRTPIKYATFQESFLQQEPSVLRVCQFLKGLEIFPPLYPMWIKAFMGFTLLMSMVFPTAASAMTGYTPRMEAFVKDKFGNALIQFSDFDLLAYKIIDGQRIALTPQSMVPYPARETGRALPVPTHDNQQQFRYRCAQRAFTNSHPDVREYGFRGLEQRNSTFGKMECLGSFGLPGGPTTLPPPTLNIEASYIGPSRTNMPFYSYDWMSPTGEHPFRNKSKIAFLEGNRTYSVQDIMDKGRCQPVSDEYQWGFSFLQLFFFTSTLLIWTIGINLLWIKTEINLPLSQYPSEVPQGWQCILYMAKRMRKDLKALGVQSATGMTDKQLRDLIETKLDGGQISFGAVPMLEGDADGHNVTGLRRWIWAWCKAEAGWAFAFVFHLGAFLALVLLSLLWRPVWMLLVASWVGNMTLLLVILLELRRLWLLIWAVLWLGVGTELLRMFLTGHL